MENKLMMMMMIITNKKFGNTCEHTWKDLPKQTKLYKLETGNKNLSIWVDGPK